jgi:hypothetical protein
MNVSDKAREDAMKALAGWGLPPVCRDQDEADYYRQMLASEALHTN